LIFVLIKEATNWPSLAPNDLLAKISVKEVHQPGVFISTKLTTLFSGRAQKEKKGG
jgi:hypothetical protein